MLAKAGSFPSPQTLHVIAVVSNPSRYLSRYRLYKQFKQHITSFEGVRLTTVELAYGNRAFEVTDPSDPLNIQLRAHDILWAKENLINIGISRLPSNWEYVAWIDADIAFTNPHWVQETLHQLQVHKVVQLFQSCADLGPHGEIMQNHTGFAYQYQLGLTPPWKTNPTIGISEGAKNFLATSTPYYGGNPTVNGLGKAPALPMGAYWHSGYAWAMRRDAFDHVGGLLDWTISGAGDHHMAMAMIGEAKFSLPGGIHKNYTDLVYQWQSRAEELIKRDIGYIDGTILHNWHGKKVDRKYMDRWRIVVFNQFDPLIDIKKNSQGVYQWATNKPALRDQMRSYLSQRNEDSIDLE